MLNYLLTINIATMARKIYIYINHRYPNTSDNYKDFKQFTMIETFTNLKALYIFLQEYYKHRGSIGAYSTFVRDIGKELNESNYYNDYLLHFSILRQYPKFK